MSNELKFEFVPLSALRGRPPFVWLYQPIVYEQAVTMLAGESAQGKTTISLHVALSLATDGQRVVWVAGEGDYDIGPRAEAWLNLHQREWPGNFDVLPHEVHFMDGTSVDAFIESLRKMRPRLVVLDSLMNMMTGGDENYAKDATKFMNICWAIVKQTGASVLVIHHAGWEGSRERGSSVLRSSPVQSFLCKMLQGSGTAPTLVTLECKKNRRGRLIGNLSYLAQDMMVAGESVLAISGPSGAPARTEPVDLGKVEALRSTFRLHYATTGATAGELQALTGMSDSTFQRAMREMIRAGEIVFDGERSKSTVYRLGPGFGPEGARDKEWMDGNGVGNMVGNIPTTPAPIGGPVVGGKNLVGKSSRHGGKVPSSESVIDLDVYIEELKK